jgi:hypothetical protein
MLDGLAAIYFLLQGSFRSAGAVWQAHMDYYKAIDKLRKKRSDIKRLEVTNSDNLILNKSVVFEFYIKGNKTYTSLIS